MKQTHRRARKTLQKKLEDERIKINILCPYVNTFISFYWVGTKIYSYAYVLHADITPTQNKLCICIYFVFISCYNLHISCAVTNVFFIRSWKSVIFFQRPIVRQWHINFYSNFTLINKSELKFWIISYFLIICYVKNEKNSNKFQTLTCFL